MKCSLEDYFIKNFDPGFMPMCRGEYGMSEEELQAEGRFWQEYVKNHIPEAYPGIKEIMEAHKAAGGILCVVSHSHEDKILRDYEANGLPVPDAVYGWGRPEHERKPNPFPLLDIMERFHLSADEILVVDDMKLSCKMAAPLGVKVAYSGWNGLGIPEIEAEMKHLCDYSFDTIAQLQQHLFPED
jgi:phosphoglycolate phosphatase/pyrophosphatase PpaX